MDGFDHALSVEAVLFWKDATVKVPIFVLATTLAIAGCSSGPEKIAAIKVSPLQYANYDCIQLREEMIRVFSRANTMTSMQRSKSEKDKMAVGAGLVLFWPALFMIGGGDVSDELANLKGQYIALGEASSLKSCPISPELAGNR